MVALKEVNVELTIDWKGLSEAVFFYIIYSTLEYRVRFTHNVNCAKPYNNKIEQLILYTVLH